MSNLVGIPELDRQPLAVDFIDNRAPSLHPAFAQSGSRYDAAFGRYVLTSPPSVAAADAPKIQPQPSTREASPTPESMATKGDTAAESMRFWDKVFPEAMNGLRENADEPKGREAAGCSIRGLVDWCQVYKVLEHCHRQYIDDSSWTQKAKKGWRNFADNGAVPVQNAWKVLVPDIEYISPVRGTIDILFDAINRAADTRRQVLENITQLKTRFSAAEQFLVVFPTDQDVLEAAISLVVSVLTAVENMIGFFVKNRVRKAMSAVFMGEDYESGVISSLEDITSASNTLHQEATKAGWSESARNWKKAEERHTELTTSIREAQGDILENQDSTKNELLSLIGGLEHNMSKRLDEAMEKGIELGLHIRATTPQPTPEWTLTAEDIWYLFEPFSVEEDDMQHILDRQERLPARDRTTSESVIIHSQFRAWMVTPVSGKLLVEASFTIHHEMSALSVLCSTLLQAFRTNPRFISLSFFCGLHTDPFDQDSGPRSMLMSFIAQLILQFPVNTSALHKQVDISWGEWDEDPEMDDLCELFFWLVCQLPATATVMCIVDGIHAYEREGYVEDLIEALGCVLDMALDGFVAATVKVLVVSPRRTVEVRQEFDEDCVLRLTTDDASRGDKVAYGVGLIGLLISACVYILVAAKYLSAVWLSCTLGVSVVSFLLASGIPIFNYLLALAGSITLSPLALGLPAYLWIYDHRYYRKGRFLSATAYWLNWLLILLSAFLMIGGTYGVIQQVIDAYATGEITCAFSCADNSNSS